MDESQKLMLQKSPKLTEARILIVDDNAADRFVVKGILSKIGIKTIQEAESVNAAIFKIENAADSKKAFHLVISDWSMPGKTGYDLLKTIRNDKKLKGTLVIIVTSSADSERVGEALALGVEDFVVKPLQHKVLAEKVEKLLMAL